MALLKYKLFGKDRKLKKTSGPVHFSDLTFEEIKKVKQRPNPYSNIIVEVPCPKNSKIIHSIPLTQAKKYRFEREMLEEAHDALTPDWANPNHLPVPIPEKYDFSFNTEDNEIVYIKKGERDSSLLLRMPAREIQEVRVSGIGFKCKYLTYDINDKTVTIKSSPLLQDWLKDNTEPETPVIDSKTEEMIRHGGGRRLCITEFGGRILNAFPQYYDPNHPTPTHRYVSHIATEYLTDFLDNRTPAIQTIMKENFERGIGTLNGGSHLLKITQEEMDQIIKEHQRIGKFVA